MAEINNQQQATVPTTEVELRTPPAVDLSATAKLTNDARDQWKKNNPEPLFDEAKALFAQALKLHKAGIAERWPAAENALSEFLTIHPQAANAPLARYYLGLTLAAQKKYPEAKAAFSEVLNGEASATLDPKLLANTMFALAEANYNIAITTKQNLSEASASIKAYLDKYPDGQHAKKAADLLSQVSAEKAAADLLQLEDQARAAIKSYESKDFKMAAESFTAFLKEYPTQGSAAITANREEVMAMLADSYAAQGSFDKAKETLAQLAATSPQSDRVLKIAEAVGNRALAAKDWPTAEEFLKQSGEQNLLGVGFAQFNQGKFKEAEASYNQHLAAHPENEEAKQGASIARNEQERLIFNEAVTALNSKDYAKSDQLFAQLINESANPKFVAPARYYLAESNYFAGKFDVAATDLQNYIDDPTFGMQAKILLADSYLKTGKFQEAMATADAYLKASPTAENAALAGEIVAKSASGLARALADSPEKNFAEAQRVLEDGINKAPGTEAAAICQLAIGDLLFKQGKFAEAKEAYYQLGTSYSAYTRQGLESLIRLGETNEKLNQSGKSFYQLVLSEPSIEENFPELKKAAEDKSAAPQPEANK